MLHETNGIVDWNPWHGCTKISPGCKYCYVYRRDAMYGAAQASSLCRKNASFDLPLRKKRDGSEKIPSGTEVFTCFTSDFLLPDADAWRAACWEMMRRRSDCTFIFFTKRIERLRQCLPPDWGEGYENVRIGCTVENRERADARLPVFLALPIRHRLIIVEPCLEAIDLRQYLSDAIEQVLVGGESGQFARECRYEWVLSLHAQCMEKQVSFCFHQTGTNFVKDGKRYHIPRACQCDQAKKARIDFFPQTHLRLPDRQ